MMGILFKIEIFVLLCLAGERCMINTRWYIEYTVRSSSQQKLAGSSTAKILQKGKFGFRPWPL